MPRRKRGKAYASSAGMVYPGRMRDRGVVVGREVVLRDLVGRRLPHVIVREDVVEHFGEVLHPMWPAHHVRMECDAHETPARLAFPIELIELRFADLRVVVGVVVMPEER